MSFFQNTSIPSGSALESLIPPSLRPYLSLSYPVSRTRAAMALSTHNHLRLSGQTLYDKGTNDVYFVAFCAVAFTVLREITLRGLMKPFANWWLASASSKARRRSPTKSGTRETKRELRQRDHTALRFAEQGWSFLYCTVFWTLGTVSPVLVVTRQTIRTRYRVSCEALLISRLVYPPPDPQPLISRIALGRIPPHLPARPDQILLPRSTRLVVPPDLRHSLGKAEKRPLADVFAPHPRHRPHHRQLLLQLHQDRHRRPRLHGLLRHPLTGKLHSSY